MSHLRNALNELFAERSAIADQQAKLAQRALAVEQGIESISHLLADSDVSNPAPVAIWTEDEGAPLWKRMYDVLELFGPMRARELAERLLESGYQTTSKDFPNVVGVNLRNFTDRFVKLDDGRWSSIAS